MLPWVGLNAQLDFLNERQIEGTLPYPVYGVVGKFQLCHGQHAIKSYLKS